MGLLKADDEFGKELYACRIERLLRNHTQAYRCFQNLKPASTEDSGQQAYDVLCFLWMSHVVRIPTLRLC
jgi:hypothetical protein